MVLAHHRSVGIPLCLSHLPDLLVAILFLCHPHHHHKNLDNRISCSRSQSRLSNHVLHHWFVKAVHSHGAQQWSNGSFLRKWSTAWPTQHKMNRQRSRAKPTSKNEKSPRI